MALALDDIVEKLVRTLLAGERLRTHIRQMQFKKKYKYDKFFHILYVLIAVLYIFSGISIYIWGKSTMTTVIGYIGLSLTGIGLILYFMINLIIDRKDIYDVLSRKKVSLFRKIDINYRIDKLIVSHLVKYPVQDLIALRETLQSNKNSLENGIAIMIGKITNVGVFPGIMSFCLGYVSLLHYFYAKWIFPFALLIGVIYLVSAFISLSVLDIEKQKSLVNMALADRAQYSI
ncbi:MAG: hypothetical protein CENE_03815 [Candidatus Celerinatantimonas neptuna]|nr:MAG: hypothetical protein CENE_03815 [Candidatus Celerinatantimonas neptuna]